jgi:hypothetical protein
VGSADRFVGVLCLVKGAHGSARRSPCPDAVSSECGTSPRRAPRPPPNSPARSAYAGFVAVCMSSDAQAAGGRPHSRLDKWRSRRINLPAFWPRISSYLTSVCSWQARGLRKPSRFDALKANGRARIRAPLSQPPAVETRRYADTGVINPPIEGAPTRDFVAFKPTLATRAQTRRRAGSALSRRAILPPLRSRTSVPPRCEWCALEHLGSGDP